MSSTPTLPTNVKDAAVTIVAADASALKTILTADAIFWNVVSLIVCSDDTSARVLQFFKTIGGTDYLIGSVNIPTLSGTDGTNPPVDILANAQFKQAIFDAFGNKIMPIDGAGTVVLKVKSLTTVTAAKTITVTAVVVKG